MLCKRLLFCVVVLFQFKARSNSGSLVYSPLEIAAGLNPSALMLQSKSAISLGWNHPGETLWVSGAWVKGMRFAAGWDLYQLENKNISTSVSSALRVGEGFTIGILGRGLGSENAVDVSVRLKHNAFMLGILARDLAGDSKELGVGVSYGEKGLRVYSDVFFFSPFAEQFASIDVGLGYYGEAWVWDVGYLSSWRNYENQFVLHASVSVKITDHTRFKVMFEPYRYLKSEEILSTHLEYKF